MKSTPQCAEVTFTDCQVECKGAGVAMEVTG